jgi:hypothetical protein
MAATWLCASDTVLSGYVRALEESDFDCLSFKRIRRVNTCVTHEADHDQCRPSSHLVLLAGAPRSAVGRDAQNHTNLPHNEAQIRRAV